MKSETASTSRRQPSSQTKHAPLKGPLTPRTSGGQSIAQRKREHVAFLKKAYPGLKTL